MILKKILEKKHAEVTELKELSDIDAMLRSIAVMPPVQSLAVALNKNEMVALLAEIKGASPSRGVIRENFNPSQIAGVYTENGAAAISVLTDREFFSGRPEYISQVRGVTDLPILRKDFIIDPVQVYQARLLGADAILLICAALPAGDLKRLMQAAGEVGLEVLVEVHDEWELDRAIKAEAEIIGINNRNLNTFVTDINTTLLLMNKLQDKSKTVVSESGIKSGTDIKVLKEAGVSAVLVGEALMGAADIASKVREMAGV